MKSQTFGFVAFTLVAVVAASTGDCIFGDRQCTCKIGDINQGLCWNKINGSNPLQCTPRSCNRGWTCSCGGRTHLCEVRAFNTLVNTGAPVTIEQVLANVRMLNFKKNAPQSLRKAENEKSIDYTPPTNSHLFLFAQSGSAFTRNCAVRTVEAANMPLMKLGDMKIGISEKGTAANQCTNVEIYLNGEELGSFSPETTMAGKNVAQEVSKRGHHSLLELKAGDLVAFRFKAASYYCYKQMTEFNINNVAIDSTAKGFETRYARECPPDWYKKSFMPELADDESAKLKAFVPLRISELPVGNAFLTQEIQPGVDVWKAPDSSDPNTSTGDFCFRLHISSPVVQQ